MERRKSYVQSQFEAVHFPNADKNKFGLRAVLKLSFYHVCFDSLRCLCYIKSCSVFLFRLVGSSEV